MKCNIQTRRKSTFMQNEMQHANLTKFNINTKWHSTYKKEEQNMKSDKNNLVTDTQVDTDAQVCADTGEDNKNGHNGLIIAVGLGVAAVATGILLTKDKEESTDQSPEMEQTPTEFIVDEIERKKNELKAKTEQLEAEARQEIERLNNKAKDLKKHLRSGYRKITKDLHKTASAISRDLK